MLQRIIDGRSDLVFDYLAAGHAATSKDERGRPLVLISLRELFALLGKQS